MKYACDFEQLGCNLSSSHQAQVLSSHTRNMFYKQDCNLLRRQGIPFSLGSRPYYFIFGHARPAHRNLQNSVNIKCSPIVYKPRRLLATYCGIPQIGSPRAGDKYFKLTVIRMYDNFLWAVVCQILPWPLSLTAPHLTGNYFRPQHLKQGGLTMNLLLYIALIKMTVRLKLLWFKELENKEYYNS